MAGKRMTQTSHVANEVLLESLSKNTLADVVIDLVRRLRGDEDLDGEALAEAVLEEAAPILRIREERSPRTDLYFATSERLSRRTLSGEELSDRLDALKQMRTAWQAR